MKITAQLKNWVKDDTYNIYWGNIHNDTRNRWPNGTRIHTSSVKEVKGNLVITLNSVYELVDN